MTLGESIPVIGQFLRITYVENPGIAFGIRVANGALFTAFSVLASVFVSVLLFTHRREKGLFRFGLLLILSGAVGNLIDRILYRHVADFIDIGIHNLRWYVFNVADSSVVIGMILLAYVVFVSDRKVYPEADTPS